MTSIVRGRKPRAGFTLMELILVMAIIVLVAAVAVPSFMAWSDGYRLQQSVDIIRTHWIKARTVAMEEGRPYRFHFEPGTGHYRLGPDDFETWPELAGAASGPTISADGYPPGLHIEDMLPGGVQLIIPQGEPPCTLLFWNDGTAKIHDVDGLERPDLILGVMDNRGNTRYLMVRAMTGGVSVVQTGGP